MWRWHVHSGIVGEIVERVKIEARNFRKDYKVEKLGEKYQRELGS